MGHHNYCAAKGKDLEKLRRQQLASIIRRVSLRCKRNAKDQGLHNRMEDI